MLDAQGELMYCSQQISIPPSFPSILKQYTKAAIRTQPHDLLLWSAAYFRALAKGETPPVRERLEYPYIKTPSGLTPGYLKVLHNQIGTDGSVSFEVLLKKWEGLCLNTEALKEMITLGKFSEAIDWMKFFAIAAGYLSRSLGQTMIIICELLTDEPEGGSASIPFTLFSDLYQYLASLECAEVPGIGPYVESNIVNEALVYLKEQSEIQSGFVMPRNTLHVLCPPLQ